MAGDAEDGAAAAAAAAGRGRAGRRRGRRGGRGIGATAVREAPDEAQAGAVPEQDALAAAPDQGHVGDRPGAHRQGGHVRRGHRVLRDPVQSGGRSGDGRAEPAAGRRSRAPAAADRRPRPKRFGQPREFLF